MVIAAGAAFTRRSLDDFNLSAAVRLQLNTDWPKAAEFKNYFDGLWSNADGTAHSQAYDSLPRPAWWWSSWPRPP